MSGEEWGKLRGRLCRDGTVMTGLKGVLRSAHRAEEIMVARRKE